MFLFITSLVILLVYQVFDYSVPVALLLLVVGFILLRSLSETKDRFFTTVALLLALGITLLLGFKGNVDKSIIYPQGLELNTISNHRNYYIQEFSGLGKGTLLMVRFGRILEIINGIVGNLFSQLRFTNFFDLKNNLSLLLFPLSMIGFTQLIIKPNRSVVHYFLIVTLINSVLINDSKLGFFLYVPLISLTVYLGIIKLISISKK